MRGNWPDNGQAETSGRGTCQTASKPRKGNASPRSAKLLAGGPDGKSLSLFADILFERVAGEDLVEYEPAALAAIARRTPSHSSAIAPGRPPSG